MKRNFLRLLSGMSLLGALVLSLAAQTTGAGTITGRVFNPANNEYVANAEVGVKGTSLTTFTGKDGTYTLRSVPEGTAVVTVDYTGTKPQTASVTVAAGGTATQDFNLTAASRGDDDKVVQLETYKVSSVRTGSAKAIQEQKASMNISNIVASEAFGDVAEGNVGEFLKNLPAIQMDNVEADARSPRIRGLPAQYTSVTMDGMRMASADGFIQNNGTDNGGGAGTGARSFGFEQVSINSVDAIEVNYTTNAAQDADSPAGNINLRTKRAFERRGRNYSFQLNGFMNSEELYLHSSIGPDDTQHRKIRPGGIFEYSDVFLDNRLGVVFNLSDSHSYNMQRQFAPTYDATPTATDTRPLVMNKLQYKDGPKFSDRTTGTLTVDFKATANLTVGWSAMYNHYLGEVGNRTVGFTATRATVPGDSFTSWTNVPVTLSSSMAYLYKRTNGYTHIVNFDYKRGALEVTGAASFSKSINNYDGALTGGVLAGTMSTGVPAGIVINATRPAADSYTSVITQVGGPDIADLANYKASATAFPQVTSDGRYANDQIFQEKLDGRFTTGWKLPTLLQFGAQEIDHTWQYRNPTSWNKWNYVGPGGGLGGTWANYPSGYQFDPGHGTSILSSSGRTAAVQDHNTVAQLFIDHPEYFVLNSAPADYLTSFVTLNKYVRETIDAGYLMATTRISKFMLQGGVRWERTNEETKDFTPEPGSKVTAAGFPVNASGVATTIPGIQYQYFTLPRTVHDTSYDNLFPSASLKYSLTKNLQFQLGYSSTITRPAYNDIAGVPSVNETNQTITIGNPNLKPQYADNYSLRGTYYFEPVGTFGLGLFENDFSNFTLTQTVDAATYGVDLLDPLYAGYEVTTKFNAPGTTRFRGMTVEYSQALSFLPKPFDGLNVFSNYTRTTVNLRAPGVSPNVINGGLSYQRKGFSVGANARWTDVTPYSGTAQRFIKAQLKVDLRGDWQFTRNLSLFLSVRNAFNTPDYVYDAANTQRINKIEYYGAYYTFGLKGKF